MLLILREKFSPGTGFEPGSPDLRLACFRLLPDESLSLFPLPSGQALVPSVRNGGEHHVGIILISGFYVNGTLRLVLMKI